MKSFNKQFSLPGRRFIAGMLCGALLLSIGFVAGSASRYNNGPAELIMCIDVMDRKMMESRANDLQKTIASLSFLSESQITVSDRIDWDMDRYIKSRIYSASVAVMPREDRMLTMTELAAITRIVKSGLSIADLNDISITNLRNGQTSFGTEESDGVPSLHPTIPAPSTG